MIHITGDTHGSKDWGKVFLASRDKKIKADDHLIIVGDFGAIWHGTGNDDKLLDKYVKLPFKILFIDGNHENFDRLYEYQIEEWNGGKIHKIRDNVFHLMRGQVFTIENKTFFTMGGGTSIDKEWRLQWELENKTDKKSPKIWWEQEIPTEEELEEGRNNLLKFDNNVDYIITHTHSNSFMKNQLDFVKEDTCLTSFLDYVLNNIGYRQWFCGHFHVDREYPDVKSRILYDEIVSL